MLPDDDDSWGRTYVADVDRGVCDSMLDSMAICSGVKVTTLGRRLMVNQRFVNGPAQFSGAVHTDGRVDYASCGCESGAAMARVGGLWAGARRAEVNGWGSN